MLSINLQSFPYLKFLCNSSWLCQASKDCVRNSQYGYGLRWIWEFPRNPSALCPDCNKLEIDAQPSNRIAMSYRFAILLQSPLAMTGRLRRDRNLQSEGNLRLCGNCEVPWNCNRIYWLLMDCKMTTGFSECCLNRSMHDAIHPRSGGLRSCSFGSVPELRGFVQLPLYYLIAGQIFKIEWIAQGLEDCPGIPWNCTVLHRSSWL